MTWRPSSAHFLAELKRRRVYGVAALYAAVGVAISLAVPSMARPSPYREARSWRDDLGREGPPWRVDVLNFV